MHRPAPVSESMDADVGEDAVTSSGPTKMDTAAPRMKRHAPLTPAEKIFAKMKTFGRLFAIVGIAAFLGGLMEARRWHMVLARVMGKLARMARLPEIVGLAMPTALCSNAAANSILVSSHADGHIRTSALIAGGMANSYLAYVSHSIRVMYPVLGAIGLPGALYFAAQFSGGFMVILGVLLWNRWYVSGHGDTPVSGIPPGRRKPRLGGLPPWEKPPSRSLTLLFRMVCITVPLMLCIEWLLKNGAFNIWEQYVPDQVNRFFPCGNWYPWSPRRWAAWCSLSAVAANAQGRRAHRQRADPAGDARRERGGQPLPHSAEESPFGARDFPRARRVRHSHRYAALALRRYPRRHRRGHRVHALCVVLNLEGEGEPFWRKVPLPPPNLPLPLQRLSTDGEATRKEFVPAKDVEEGSRRGTRKSRNGGATMKRDY